MTGLFQDPLVRFLVVVGGVLFVAFPIWVWSRSAYAHAITARRRQQQARELGWSGHPYACTVLLSPVYGLVGLSALLASITSHVSGVFPIVTLVLLFLAVAMQILNLVPTWLWPPWAKSLPGSPDSVRDVAKALDNLIQ